MGILNWVKKQPKTRVLFATLLGLSLASALVAGIVLNNNNYFVTPSSVEPNASVPVETFLKLETAYEVLNVTPKDLVGEQEWLGLEQYLNNEVENVSGLAALEAFMFSFYLNNVNEIEQLPNGEDTEIFKKYLEAFVQQYDSSQVPSMISKIVELREKLGLEDERELLLTG